VVVPQAYKEHSTREVLVMEYIPGNKLISAVRQDDINKVVVMHERPSKYQVSELVMLMMMIVTLEQEGVKAWDS